MFSAPPVIETEIFARLPDNLRVKNRVTPWIAARQHGQVHSFLEGPSFDREGNLYCTDIPYGRIFKITPDGVFHLVAEYEGGEPNGLKIHKDGRLFIADHRYGLLVLDPAGGTPKPLLSSANTEGFRGLNDMIFAKNGDLYFTDQGQSGFQDPSGRVFRLTADGTLTCIMRNIPSPNGIVLSRDERVVYLNVTRANAVWRLPLLPSGEVSKAGMFLQLSGGLGGPDGLAIDESGGLAVGHAGLGTVWIFNRIGEPVYRVKSCAGLGTTNLAYGGPDRKTLYITESETGCILKAKLPVAGNPLYSHM
jgi:gluconolactonase